MDKELNITGKHIYYRVKGDGKPVMLVHGFGETGDVWKNQAGHPQTPPREGLTGNFKFIIPDLPGSGQSDMIDDMSVEGMAEVLKQILDTELNGFSKSSRGGAVSLIGHSMGGYITLAFVEKYASHLGSYGLFQSTAFPDSEEKKVARKKGIDFIKEHGAFGFLKSTTPNLFSTTTKEKSPALVDEFIQSLEGFSPEALISYYESMIKRPDRTEVLKNTRLPVLLVMGEYDTAIPLNDALKLCSMPEKAYIHVLHQSGHMGMLEEPDKSNRLLEEFLSEV